MTARTGRAVCVVGSFMMDLTVRVPVRPAPGETVFGTSFEQYLGGKGCNQAITAARSGSPTAMVGRLGADEYGREFRQRLDAEGIDHTAVLVDPDNGTGIGLPVVDDRGENSIIVVPRANHAVTPADIEAARAQIEGAGVLLLQLELPVDASLAAARLARRAGVTVVLNPAPAVDDLADFAGLVDVIVPNEGEAIALAGAAPGEDPLVAARALHGRLGASVVVTLGGDGSAVVSPSAPPTPIPSHPVELVDSVGAGDVFCGSLAACLAGGAGLQAAARYANAAAAVSVTRNGAEPSIPVPAEVTRVTGIELPGGHALTRVV